jgi:hypothetical protein
MPDEPCPPVIPPAKWWETSGVRSGLISVVCGILMILGYTVDVKMQNKVEVISLVLLPAIGAIGTGIHEIYKRYQNNRCKRDIIPLTKGGLL